MATETDNDAPSTSSNPDSKWERVGNASIDRHASSEGGRSASNKAPASSTAGNGTSARQSKGGGAPYDATSNNFTPSSLSGSPSGGGGFSGGAGRPGMEGNGGEQPLPAGTQRFNRDQDGNKSPHPNQNYIRPGEAAGGAADVGENLRQLENQESSQPLTNYDDEKDSDKASAGGKRKPWQRKSQGKRAKQDATGTGPAGAPSLKLKMAEKANIFQKGSSAKQSLKGKIVQRVKKKKWKYIAGGVGVGGAFFLLMLIMFLLGSLLIPHFVSNMMEYEFVRLTRASYSSTERVMDEQETDAVNRDTAAGQAMQDAFGTEPDGQQNPMLNAETDDLTPGAVDESRVAANGDEREFNENYEKVDNVERLQSVTTEDPETGASETEKITGGFENGSPVEPSAAVSDASTLGVTKAILNTDNPDEGGGAVQEPEITAVDEDQADEAPTGLDEAKYPDNQTEKADEIQDEDDTMATVYTDEGAGSSGLGNEQGASENEAKAFEALEDDPAEVAEAAAESGNLPNQLINFINGQFSETALNAVASDIGEALNPDVSKLIPLCMIYENMKFNGPTAEAQSGEDERAAILTMAVSDQQKRGSPYFTANMGDAESWKLNGDPRSGGVQDSVVIERSSGENVTTTSQTSAEGSPLGGLQTVGNILLSLGIPAAGTLAPVLDFACPYITNVWIGAGLGILNLGVLIFTTFFAGPEGDVAEGAIDASVEAGGDAAATTAADGIVANIASDSVTDESSSGFSALNDFGNNLIKFGKAVGKEGRQLIVVGGLTTLAVFAEKMSSLAESGILNGGLATGPQFDNQVDQGTNILTNAEVANAYGGRPLTNTEAMQVQQDDNHTLAELNQSQSAYQRYLALSNPQSLASVMLDRVAVNLNYGFFSSVMADLGNIFNPASLVPQVLFGGISGQANAASNIDTEDYGDVQQGYSDTEYALIAREPSYRIPSENEYYLLANPAEESQVEETYSPCFTESVATLLANGDIVRTDGQGDISETQGLCSPQNLGPNNPQYGDLVFRYRLSLSYNTTVNILEGLAYANNTNTANETL